MAVRKLRIARFVSARAHWHVARGVYAGGTGPMGLHTHDFPEVFWIETGRGTHLVNGAAQPLEAGDLVLIRPEDAHGFRGGTGGLTMVNVAFRRHVLDELRQRYFTGPRAAWPWRGEELPASRRLEPAELERLSASAEGLLNAAQSRFTLDRFLMDVLALFAERAEPPSHAGLPPWLAGALREFGGSSEHLIGGVPALAALAGRSREHVNRVIRRATNQTATQLVNAVRLERAAHDLRMTAKPIAHVAIDAGLPNLGYFYRRFTARYGVTPRKYRLRAQAVVRG